MSVSCLVQEETRESKKKALAASLAGGAAPSEDIDARAVEEVGGVFNVYHPNGYEVPPLYPPEAY